MSHGPNWTKWGAVAAIIAIPITALLLILENPLKCWAGTGECLRPIAQIADSLPPLSLPGGRTTHFTLESGHAPDGVHGAVQSLLQDGKRVTSVAFAPGGGWVVVWNGTQYRAQGLSPRIRSVLDSLAQARSPIRDIVFAPWGGTDSWAIIHGDGQVAGNELPPGAAAALNEARRTGTPVSSIALGGMGAWLLVHPDRVRRGGPMPESESREVDSALQSRIPRTLRLLEAGGYLAQYDDRSWTAWGLPGRAAEELERLRQRGKRVYVASFAPGGGWLIVAEEG